MAIKSAKWHYLDRMKIYNWTNMANIGPHPEILSGQDSK